jgi:hypothetical protein
MRADGLPGLVHPACYPAYAAQQRSRGADPTPRPLYEPALESPSEPRPDA